MKTRNNYVAFSSYFNVTDDLNAFNKIRIQFCITETILFLWSYGNSSNPDTINYRTTKPSQRDYFVHEFLAQYRTMNVFVVSTKE